MNAKSLKDQILRNLTEQTQGTSAAPSTVFSNRAAQEQLLDLLTRTTIAATPVCISVPNGKMKFIIGLSLIGGEDVIG